VASRLKLLLEKLGYCCIQSQLLDEVGLSGIQFNPLLFLTTKLNLTLSWGSELLRIGYRGPPLILNHMTYYSVPNQVLNVLVDLLLILHVLLLQCLRHGLLHYLLRGAPFFFERITIVCRQYLRGSDRGHHLALVLLLNAPRGDHQEGADIMLGHALELELQELPLLGEVEVGDDEVR